MADEPAQDRSSRASSTTPSHSVPGSLAEESAETFDEASSEMASAPESPAVELSEGHQVSAAASQNEEREDEAEHETISLDDESTKIDLGTPARSDSDHELAAQTPHVPHSTSASTEPSPVIAQESSDHSITLLPPRASKGSPKEVGLGLLTASSSSRSSNGSVEHAIPPISSPRQDSSVSLASSTSLAPMTDDIGDKRLSTLVMDDISLEDDFVPLASPPLPQQALMLDRRPSPSSQASETMRRVPSPTKSISSISSARSALSRVMSPNGSVAQGSTRFFEAARGFFGGAATAIPEDAVPKDSPRLQSPASGVSPSIASAVWRSSLASGGPAAALSPVSLSNASFLSQQSEATDVAQAHNRETISSALNGSSSDTDFLIQRVNAQNQILNADPKAKRQSIEGREVLRESFQRIHEEVGDDDVMIDWGFWGSVAADYERVAKEQPRELSRAIQRGIPSQLRGMMWQLMSSSKDPELEVQYGHLLKQPSPHEKAIMRDLARTFPSLDYFKDYEGEGQATLYNVVKAYSLFDPEVGYCQGLAFVMPDEEAFCVLVRLMKSYDLRSLYVPEMPGLQLRLFQLDRLLEDMVPAVFLHLLRQGIKSSMYAAQWYMTMLSYRLPLELVSSVFDLVLAEGVEAMLRFSIALLRRNEEAILKLTFEQLLEFLKSGLFEPYRRKLPDGTPDAEAETAYDASAFVKDALQVKLSPSVLDAFAHEWDQMNAHNTEIIQLRQVNSQLSSQVRKLEGALAQMNEEHVGLVRQLVNQRLEQEALEAQVVKMKMAVAEAGVEIIF